MRDALFEHRQDAPCDRRGGNVHANFLVTLVTELEHKDVSRETQRNNRERKAFTNTRQAILECGRGDVQNSLPTIRSSFLPSPFFKWGSKLHYAPCACGSS